MADLKGRRIFSKNSFSLKIFIGFTSLILFLLLSINFFFHKPLRNFNVSSLKKNLISLNLSLESEVKRLIKHGDLRALDDWVKVIGEKINTRITIIKPEGEVIADSHKDPGTMDNHSDRPEIISAIKNDEGYSMRFSASVGEQMLYVATTITEKEEASALIRTSIYLRDISVFIGTLKGNLMKISLIFFLIALAVSWLLSKKFNKPVRSIIDATEKFASGDFNSKLFFDSNDEFGRLAGSFNKMVDQQEFIISKLTEREEELSTIISSMEEGLIVINRAGNIIHSNSSFRKMCDAKETVEVLYWQVIRIPKIEEMISRSFESEKSIFEELKYNGRHYLATFSKIYDSERMVITFKDITALKKLEAIKKEFVLNLTHELKTPLTAIMGFVETLEDEEDIKNKNYIEIIKRHTNRMNMIVSDLMTISEIEDESTEFELKKVNISAILSNIIKIFNEKIENKGITLNIDLGKNLPEILGEEFKLEQMFINLIDNAHKYTDEGEINISLSHQKKEKVLRFLINNTGSHIPEDSLPRIFERFFVVDKSRSRNLGGTGLGLSIVKHVVQLHSGNISVKTNPETGTTFIVDLPVSDQI